MTKNNNRRFVTLLDLSEKFKVKKSSLIYYVQMGILVPEMFAGKAALFEEGAVTKVWEEINKLRKDHTLAQIREIFIKKNANKKR
jgi:DNA-binding transcriptional MerR regulator